MRLKKTTNEELAEFAVLLEEAFLESGVDIPRGSEVAGYIDAAKRLSRARIEGEDLSNMGEPKFLALVEKVLECQRLATAVRWARSEPNLARHMERLLRGSVDPTAKKRTAAKDKAFELIMHSIFNSSGICARLAEPDIVFALEGREYSIACKCLYSPKNIQKQISRAKRQIVESGRRGLIAMSIENVVRLKDLLFVPDLEALNDRITRAAGAFAKHYDTQFAKWINTAKVIGLMMSLSSLITVQRENLFLSAQHVILMNRVSEDSPYFSVLTEINELLFRKQP
ncbi:MAG: hypothetical protein ABIJ61_12010 [bacterium]